MFFQRYYLDCLAHASYLIADAESKVAAVIDPQRDVDQYIEDAEAKGFRIRYVFLTHFHADFVAGHIELRERTRAKIYLGEHADAEYEFTPIKDGDMLQFGQVRLKILATPGHTPEGISIVVYDLDESDLKPHGVLTGDTLFIGDVGRPDLLASIGFDPDVMAGQLYDSLHLKLMQLPDPTLVYPAHGAGSMCGRQLGSEFVSTIGEQKAYNYALQPMSRSEFKTLVTADQPKAPKYFTHDSLLNRKDRESLDKTVNAAMLPIDLAEVITLRDNGAQFLDVRDSATFAAAHLRGSINIGLNGQFATWCGTLLETDLPIVVIGDLDQIEEAVTRLGRIGFDQVKGYLEHGPKALGPRPDVVGRVDRVTVRALADESAVEEFQVIDVRSNTEWKAAHIENSLHLPLDELTERLDEIDRDTRIALHCQTGYRSAAAVSILLRNGFESIVDVVGGFDAWTASGLPVTGNAATWVKGGV